MNDMRATIIPKSDQINADDLIGGDMTITVSRVTIDTASEQPVAIHYEGDRGKPYKACKSMRRVLVSVWGADANEYVGRSMTLYRDPGVQFGGMAVGGIRISHMSHMPHNKPATMALTATRANRKPFTVKPLAAPAPKPDVGQDKEGAPDKAREEADAIIIAMEARDTVEAFDAFIASKGVKRWLAWAQENRDDQYGRVMDRQAELFQGFERTMMPSFGDDVPADQVPA